MNGTVKIDIESYNKLIEDNTLLRKKVEKCQSILEDIEDLLYQEKEKQVHTDSSYMWLSTINYQDLYERMDMPVPYHEFESRAQEAHRIYIGKRKDEGYQE